MVTCEGKGVRVEAEGGWRRRRSRGKGVAKWREWESGPLPAPPLLALFTLFSQGSAGLAPSPRTHPTMSDSDAPDQPAKRRRRHIWQSKPAQAAKVRALGSGPPLSLPRMRHSARRTHLATPPPPLPHPGTAAQA